jgi:coproporphyrinogen III oxidase
MDQTRNIGGEYFDYLEAPDVKEKIAYTKRHI